MLSYSSWEKERRKDRTLRSERSAAGKAAKKHLEEDAGHSCNQYLSSLVPPLQKAAQADLQTLGKQFVKKILQQQPAHLFGVQKGTAFRCFKAVAKQKKLASLHQFLPHKSDSAAYSQLLYVSCLDLMDTSKIPSHHESEQSSEQQELSFLFNAFYIFALYFLHETNPLAVAPPLDATGPQALTTMPMAVVNKCRPSPRLIYRRNFRPLIRVDSPAYVKLLQLKEVAHSRQGPVALDLVHILDRLWPLLDLSAYPGPMSLQGFSQRQHQVDSFNPGLQPTRNEKNSQELLIDPDDEDKSDASSQLSAMYDDPLDKSQKAQSSTEKSAPIPSWLLTRIKFYVDTRDKLRLPPPSTGNRRHEQIRRSMANMSASRGWEDQLFGVTKSDDEIKNAELTRLTTQIKRKSRTINFASYDAGNDGTAIQDTGQNKGGDGTMQNSDRAEPDDPVATKKDQVEEDEKKELSFELKLPPALSSNLRKSLEEAVSQLVNRDGPLVLEPLPAMLQRTDDVSTLASVGVSEAASIAASLGTKSGIGRGALKQLLEQANAGSASVGTASGVGRGALDQLLKQAASENASVGTASVGTASGVGRGALDQLLKQAASENASVGTASGVGRGALEALLAQASPHKDTRTVDADRNTGASFLLAENEGNTKKTGQSPTLEDVSDMSDEDELLSTTGASTVGKRALGDLILEASRASRKTTGGTKRRRRKPAQRKEPSQTKLPQRKPKRQKQMPVQKEVEESSDEVDESDEDHEVADQDLFVEAASVSGQGQSALKDLLAKALG